jgi:zinc/manganese transport system permease protein
MILGLLRWLPDMLGHDFIRHAFVAGTFVALASGLVGYFVVLRNQVFATEALSHVAFTGVLAAVAAGLDPQIGLFSATAAGAAGIGALGGRRRGRDVVVGVVFAWVLGLGALCLSLYTTSRSGGDAGVGIHALFGSIYGLSGHDTAIAAAVGATVSVLVLTIARPLLFASLDSEVAAARGVPARLLSLVFLLLVAATVAEAVRAVGALLLIALVVTPAATAHRLTTRPYTGLGLAATLSVAFVWVGLTLGYAFQRIPPSFLVVALAFVSYAGAVLRSRLRARGRGLRPGAATLAPNGPRPRPRRR